MPSFTTMLAALAGAFGVLLIAHLAARGRREARLRSAQDALRVSEERLRLALDATSEIVWDWDLRDDSMYNPRFGQVYGYPEDRIPRTASELLGYVHPEDLPALGAQIEEARRGARDGLEVEHRIRTSTGEWRWMLAKARVVSRGPGGDALRIVGTCADVTDRRRMLERLQLADRMASVGTLAAGVAHEINNPLSFVSSNLGFAIDVLGGLQRPGADADAARRRGPVPGRSTSAGRRSSRPGRGRGASSGSSPTSRSSRARTTTAA